MPVETMILIAVAALFVFIIFIFVISRYRKCPSDKVLVIYGKVGTNPDGSPRSAKCIHGGAAFIWPVIQASQYMDLTPLTINSSSARRILSIASFLVLPWTMTFATIES